MSVNEIEPGKYRISYRDAQGLWKRKVFNGTLSAARAMEKDLVAASRKATSEQQTYVVFAEGVSSAFRILAESAEHAANRVERLGHRVVVVTILYGEQNLLVTEAVQQLELDDLVEQYGSYWIDAAGQDVKSSRERTWRKDRASLTRGVKSLRKLGCRFMRDVTPKHIVQLQDRLAKSGLSRATVDKVRRVCSPAWTWAMRREWVDSNPWSVWVNHRKVKSAPKTLTRSQVAEVLAAAVGKPVYPVLATAALAGLRNGELVRLKVKHITEDGVVVQSEAGAATKSRKARLVPWVFEELRPILSAIDGEPDDYAFLRYRTDDAMCRAVNTFKRHNPDLPDFTLQTLRRSFVTMLIKECGMSHGMVQQWAGHASVSTTQNYYLGQAGWSGEAVSLGRGAA